jgi:hypothetical protein
VRRRPRGGSRRKYETFRGLESAHIVATETRFPEKYLVALLSPVWCSLCIVRII